MTKKVMILICFIMIKFSLQYFLINPDYDLQAYIQFIFPLALFFSEKF
jgi:hypothetical protein